MCRLIINNVFLCNRLSVPIPSVSTSASSYGAFMGLSGNMRYQLLNGAERLMQDHFQHLGVVIFFSAALRYVPHCARAFGSNSNSLLTEFSIVQGAW